MTMPAEPRAPRATYRLQLGRDLTFDDAAALVPYLAALGISDCYTSPFFETSSENSHGYDVSDHNRIRAELGGEPALGRFSAALKRHGLGLIIDLVPNHMGIARNRNAWWLDVLEHGAASRPHYRARQDDLRLYDGVLPMLADLRQRHHWLAVATGKSRRGLDDALRTVQLKGVFDASRTADETEGKPHPLMLQELMNELGCEPRRTLMIGDTTHDLQMALNAGCPSVGGRGVPPG